MAVTLVVVRIVANRVWPGLALAWTAMLALAAVLCVPIFFAGVLRLGDLMTQRFQMRLKLLHLVLESLRDTTLRSLALVATGAAALFGAVALGGARDDLVRESAGSPHNIQARRSIWAVTPSDNQSVIAFSPDDHERRIASLPGVLGVEALDGSLLNFGDRRIWVLAWPPASRLQLLDGQIVKGDGAEAVSRLHSGGWARVSQQLAAEHDVRVGGTLTLPTPTGEVRMRVAALTTNFGWSPGAILLNATDFARVWDTAEPTALAVKIRPGVRPVVVRGEINRALGSSNGLEVLTTQAREERINGSAREGLSQLATISTLLVLASILAMAAALVSVIWQRRISLAELKLSGVTSLRLRELLVLESAVTLGVGAVTGTLWGIYGQVALDGYLTASTGFPVARLGASWRPLEVLVVVFGVSLAISAIPVWLTARVSARVALGE